MFYSNDEYAYQLQRHVDMGMSFAQATTMVETMMEQERAAYEDWLAECAELDYEE